MNFQFKDTDKLTNRKKISNKIEKQYSSPLLNRKLYESDKHNQFAYVMHKKKREQKVRKPPADKNKGHLFNKLGKQTFSSLTLLSPIWHRYKSQQWNKQKKHFNSKNPQTLKMIYSDKTSAQTPFLNLSRYKKIVHDFQDRINYSQQKNVLSRTQSHGSLTDYRPRSQEQHSGRKHGYKLNMFKESIYLGIQNINMSMRKPCLARTRSTIQFG